MGWPVRIRWRKRRWVCPDAGCPLGTFVEQDESIAAPRSSLTRRACWWAIEQIRREHASVNGVRRQLGAGWRTVWDSIKPIVAAAAADESRFVAGVPQDRRSNPPAPARTEGTHLNPQLPGDQRIHLHGHLPQPVDQQARPRRQQPHQHHRRRRGGFPTVSSSSGHTGQGTEHLVTRRRWRRGQPPRQL
jgi:hypothetical protein